MHAGSFLVQAQPAPEEEIGFSDYGSDFRVETQASHPRIKCFDWRGLTSWRTPAEQFFEFHQTTAAAVELNQWRLHVSGSVARPRSFVFSDLERHPAKEIAAVIECSGNSGQSRLMNGLVSNGVWSGPALAPLLRECGVLPEAREVVFFGADAERERKWPAGEKEFEVPHGRSLFVQDTLEENVILATRLNGRPLSPEHGYPLRLVSPGWYGMTQIKWLTRIVVLDRRYEGRHMARNYHSVHTSGNLAIEASIGRNRLKSVIARVARTAGQHAISGAAWGGRDPVERVEVRIDGGRWQEAEIAESGAQHAWSLWRIPWTEATSGHHTIVSRAIDSRGEIQPTREEWVRSMASSREDNSQWARKIMLP